MLPYLSPTAVGPALNLASLVSTVLERSDPRSADVAEIPGLLRD
jgi:hypothetical protein